MMNGTKLSKTGKLLKKLSTLVNVPLKRYKPKRTTMTKSATLKAKSKTSFCPTTDPSAKSDLPLKGELVLSKYGSPIFNNNNNKLKY